MGEKQKRETPKEVIESIKRPYFEHIWVKYPGEKMINVTSSHTIATAEADMDKVAKLVQEHLGKRLTSAHNHPNYNPFLKGILGSKPTPSLSDFNNFLGEDRVKTMVIAQNNAYTGELEGYGVYKKTKRTPSAEPPLFQRFLYGFASEIGLTKTALNYYAGNFDIKYRFIPAEGYHLRGNKFVKSDKKSLEGKVSATTAIIGLLGSIFFLSANLTGNVISNLSLKTSNMIGVVLFLVGVVGGLFYFRRKFSKRTK
ncbi:hypothetical protein HYT26_02675 [Candidatus Pacearchaeota archaeon]|nr:hypothetical protein [Candidatus Pacearchaeota archaeon]